MGTFTVTDELINSPQAEAYFLRADRRVMIGLRATMEILRLPVPDYAKRGKPGRTPARDVAMAYAVDHPAPPTTPTYTRKPNATPERVAAARPRLGCDLGHLANSGTPRPENGQFLRAPNTLFDETFSG